MIPREQLAGDGGLGGGQVQSGLVQSEVSEGLRGRKPPCRCSVQGEPVTNVMSSNLD